MPISDISVKYGLFRANGGIVKKMKANKKLGHRIKDMNKRIFIAIIIVIVVLFIWFLIRGSEDTWICVDGEWIKHGVPSAPMPTEPCGEESVACTMDAKLCPDGSYVSRIPPKCEFAPCPETKTIKLYYYNSELDRDESGNTACSRNGLVAVERKIPITQTPIQDAIKLLLSGELTAEERAQGINTEYPLEGVSLKGASLKDDVLTLEFDDSKNKTVGGSCRVGILWFQIEATAKQFPGVKQVKFLPEELFQP